MDFALTTNTHYIRSDLAHAGVTLGMPYFLPVEPMSQISLGPAEILWDDWTLAGVRPQLAMTDVLDKLRVLSHILDKKCTDSKELAYFSAAIFNTQYQITTFTTRNIFVEGHSYNLEASRTFSSLLYRNATSISFCIYINMVLRKLPLRAVLHVTMAMHLKSDLEKPGNELLHSWASNLELLLWVLFIGAAATTGSIERTYFMNHLKLVIMELRVTNFENFVRKLRLTVWSEAFCFPQSKVLWKEMSCSSLG